MTLDELLSAIERKQPPTPPEALARFEAAVGNDLPNDYREFLIRCNGGYTGGAVRFDESSPDGRPAEACLHHIGGFREETYFSLEVKREIYAMRIPRDLIWIADDPCGNAICLGVFGDHRGRVFFWDHENEPDPVNWDGRVRSTDNVTLLADSFTEFVTGLRWVTAASDRQVR